MTPEDPDAWMWERAKAKLQRAEGQRGPSVRLEDPDAGRPGWEPAVDLFVSSEGVRVLVALSGLELDRVEVEVAGAVLVVRGERPGPDVPAGAALHRKEIPHGSFERRIELPPGLYALARRRGRRGCLLLDLRRDPLT